jgi:hypothetical protein
LTERVSVDADDERGDQAAHVPLNYTGPTSGFKCGFEAARSVTLLGAEVVLSVDPMALPVTLQPLRFALKRDLSDQMFYHCLSCFAKFSIT